jgi:hypothetical protein
LLKTIAEWIVYSNAWISVGAVAFAMTAASYLQFNIPASFLIFIFITTLFAYNFQRLVKLNYANVEPISGPRANWLMRHQYTVYVTTVLSAIGGIMLGWPFFVEHKFVLVLIGMLSFFYVWKLPFLKRNLRSLPGLKIFVLSFTWVLACQILPFLLFSSKPVSVVSNIFFVSSFLFVFSISIPFDIRDIKVDCKDMNTIPQLLGIKNAKWLGIVMLAVSSLLIFIVIKQFTIALIISTIVTGIIIGKSEVQNEDLYYSGLVDGTVILHFVLLYFIP